MTREGTLRGLTQTEYDNMVTLLKETFCERWYRISFNRGRVTIETLTHNRGAITMADQNQNVNPDLIPVPREDKTDLWPEASEHLKPDGTVNLEEPTLNSDGFAKNAYDYRRPQKVK